MLRINCADVLHALAISARLVRNNVDFAFKTQNGEQKILIMEADIDRVQITLAGLPFEIKKNESHLPFKPNKN